ncbi:MAG: sec-independent protein translocase protein TatC [Candidatus Nitrosomirales archaeon]|jgi:sec-independent protein translocase protein TatC
MDRERPLMEHLQELRGRLVKIAIAVGIVTSVCVAFGVQMYEINGYTIPILYPDPLNNVAIQLMAKMQKELLPENVTLVQLKPGEVFFAQFYVAILLGVMLAMPVIVREMAGFIAPGLYKNEKGMIKKITAPAVALFAAGCLFSYFFAIPFILGFLYQYGTSLGVSTLLNVTEFVSFVMQFLIAFGFSYELPIIMWAVSAAGMVEPRFWRDNLRWAVVIIAIFGAVITPDGSGITMWFVAGPMILLYVVAMIFIEKKLKKTAEPTYSLSDIDRAKLREAAKSRGIDYTNMSDEELKAKIEKLAEEERLKQENVKPKS